jgi:chromate transporter
LILGFTGFGGPLAIIEIMRKDLVLKKNWITMQEFENYIGYSQIAPGPLAFQVALYTGYYRNGIIGAVLAGFGLVFPSFLLLLGFSIFYIEYKDITYVKYALYGLAPVITAIIFHSGFKLSISLFKKDIFLYSLFFASILAGIFLKFNIIYLIIISALISLIFYSLTNKEKKLNIFSAILLIPLIHPLLALLQNVKGVLSEKLIELTLLFLKVGSLTYGSGFVIVGVLRQEVVEKLGWLTAKEFIDGIAFGQITPGPVVITSTFIGYMVAGIPGSIISTLFIFLPTFIFVMLLAPRIKKFKDNFYLRSLIKGANAAAIGAILSTAYFLSIDSLTDIYALILFVLAMAVLFSTKFNALYLILLSAIGGIAIKIIFN